MSAIARRATAENRPFFCLKLLILLKGRSPIKSAVLIYEHMNNKILYIIIVLLLAVLVGGGTYFVLSRQGGTKTEIGNQPAAVNQPPAAANQAPTTGAAPATPAGGFLSEQSNKAKYDEYLSDIYLGKMAIGKKIGTDGFPTKTNVFTAGTDQFCTMMTLKKTIPSGNVAIAIYDVVTKQDNQPKMVFPVELKAGGSGGCGDLTQPAGKYEYKLYINDVLVSILPFEVK